ncbi:MAG: hypothetical protein C0410_08285 [Anaerolinea sp.]|nr:hypothetical protein [Anaerolinea sp.]
MNKPKLIKIMFILITVLIVTACNLPLNLDKNADNDAENTFEETDTPSQGVFAEKVDSKPVGLQEGLGSLDSYMLTLFLRSSDSKGALTEMTETVERSVVDKNSHTTTVSRSFDPENDTEENNSTDETYVIGNVTCSGSGEDWTYSEMTAQEKEMLDVYKGMVDVIPLIDNPEFVGEEMVNGVDTNHFTFQLSGIGDSSGSVATVNSGDYWLAKDGNYIVKYHLLLEVQSAAEGTQENETSNIEASIDLTNINVPITFTLPQYCVPSSE